MDLAQRQAAVEAARVCSYAFPNSFAPHEYFPQLLKLESRVSLRVISLLVICGQILTVCLWLQVPAEVREDLAARGHEVVVWPGGDFDWAAGAVCVLERSGDGRVLSTGADPRRACYAAGW